MSKAAPRHKWTPDEARAAALKGHEARRMRLIESTATSKSVQEQQPENKPPDDYLLRRLARVRHQLDLIDEAIRTELKSDTPNGQRLNWLCSAQERLSEQERQLAGRPLPGSLRPTAKQQRNYAPQTPSDPEE